MKRNFTKKNIWSCYLVLATLLASAFLLSHAACNAAASKQEEAAAAFSEMQPTSTDGIIGRLIALRLPQLQISKHPLDETISKRAYGLYLKSLDPMKYYFYQSDLDEFEQKEYPTKISSDLKSGKVNIGFDIFNRYLQRFDERTAMTRKILQQELDFTVDEEFVVDKDLWAYPKTEEEAYNRCRQKVKLDILKLKAENRNVLDGKNGEPDTKSALAKAQEDPLVRLERRYESAKRRIHLTNNNEVLEIYFSSIMGAYDPHSSYMSQESYDAFVQLMGLDLEGIGASLMSEDGVTTIKEILSGGPAEKDARLQIDDKIIGVGQGKDGEIVNVVDWKLNDVVMKIRGKKGTTVRLQIIPDDGSGTKIIELVRDKVELEESQARAVVFEVGKKDDGTSYRVGVIDLPSFYFDMTAAERGDRNPKSMTTDVRAVLEKFNAEGVDVVVLDLSKNGGGSLTEAVASTGLFVESAPVVQLKQLEETRVRPLYDTDPGIVWTGPLVVVTSKLSASASEIFAGAIKDYKRGIVVGDSRTHGKGSVQSMMPLAQQNRLFGSLTNPPQYGALKLTIQQYYLPGGTSPQIKGVEADIVIPSLIDYIKDLSESDLDYSLSYDEVKALEHPNFGFVTPEIVAQLKKDSEQRVAANEEFQRTQRKIQTYVEIKDRKTIPLNEESYNADQARLDTDREEKEKFEKIVNNKSKITRDFYLDEVMNIAVDYTKLLKEAGLSFKPTAPPKRTDRIFL